MTGPTSPVQRRIMLLCLVVMSICLVIVARRGDVLSTVLITVGAANVARMLRFDR